MSVQKNRFACVLLIAGALAMQACTTRPVAKEGDFSKVNRDSRQDGRDAQASNVLEVRLGRKTEKPLALIATDMVNALVQIPGLGKPGRNLRIPRARTQFDLEVGNALRAKGYAISLVSAKSGADVVLSSVIRNIENTSSLESTYIVAVNRVALKRSYSVIDRTVAPTTASLYVRGVEPGLIQLDDRIFISNDARS